VVRDAQGALRAKFPVTRAEEQSQDNLLQPVFENGKLLRRATLAEIRARVEADLALEHAQHAAAVGAR
jgi:nicotinic acid phosphoribosyltransferase